MDLYKEAVDALTAARESIVDSHTMLEEAGPEGARERLDDAYRSVLQAEDQLRAARWAMAAIV